MQADGIHLHDNADVIAIERLDDGRKRLQLNHGGTLEVDEVFYAVGREPKVAGLFEDVDIAQAENGALLVDAHFQTSVPGIYAVGDVIDRVQLTPVALAEGMWLAHHLFGKTPAHKVDYQHIPTAVFCHPNVATVGLTQEQALNEYGVIRVYRSSFRPLRYTLGEGGTRSLMKLIVDDASDRVVGLHMAGDEAAEIVQGFAVAVSMGATKAAFDRTLGIHPSSAEEFVTMRQGETVTL
jgi:glutathione reductase (NADPH)